LFIMKIGIVGASGYAGGELIRLLARHPKVEIAAIGSRSYLGKPLSEAFPSLAATDLPLTFVAPEEMDGCDLVFLAVPHGVASGMAGALVEAGQKVIDIGADFRIKDLNIYKHWYKVDHKAEELLTEAVYGLPELYRDKIKDARVVGNPGCYPTSVILALAPLLKTGFAAENTIVIDSLSGVSGAGRAEKPLYHFPHCAENLVAYGVGTHRHVPEIEQELSLLAGTEVKVTFTPHLVPVIRGILTTITVGLKKDCETEELIEVYRNFYKGEYFVRILGPERIPETKDVLGSNFCEITARVDKRLGRAVIVSAIDNLGKGAASQAVQNMNIMAGWDEKLGIEQLPIYP
jgi:N-acetyl-gamma-glutamyl-phosphate reductase